MKMANIKRNTARNRTVMTASNTEISNRQRPLNNAYYFFALSPTPNPSDYEFLDFPSVVRVSPSIIESSTFVYRSNQPEIGDKLAIQLIPL
jgi:hypothetical protein